MKILFIYLFTWVFRGGGIALLLTEFDQQDYQKKMKEPKIKQWDLAWGLKNEYESFYQFGIVPKTLEAIIEELEIQGNVHSTQIVCVLGLVSSFNSISTLFRLFNAKAILLEEQ